VGNKPMIEATSVPTRPLAIAAMTTSAGNVQTT
jgi:hypothetical protein